MLTNNDVLKLQVQLSDIMLRQADAENGVKLAMIGLNNILSIPLSTEIEIASAVNLVSADYKSLSDLTVDAVNARPEIKAMEQRIKMSEAGVKMAQSNWYPQIALVGDYIYSRPNQRIFPTKDEFKGTWDVGVNLSLNVWDWFTTVHQTDQAEASLAQAIDSKQVIKDGITLEVTQSYLTMNTAKQKISITELAVTQATENNKILSEKFKQGMALSSEVIDAEVALLTAKTNLTNSIVDYELSKAKLEKSLGK
jgi:outer membrane protein TolC